MAVDRPTFHESWYRVKDLKPRLRSLVQSYRQHYRAAMWQVLCDPASNKFYRLDEINYFFVGLLDGRRTVDEVWQIACDQLEHDAPTQGEIIQLLGQLYTNNLLEADLPPDVEGMFDRYRKRKRREVTGYLTNIMFARIPLYDPDRLLNRWVGVCGWLFGPIGLALWAGLLVYALTLLIGDPRADTVVAQAMGDPAGTMEGVLAPGNLWMLYAAMVVTKLLHELGHGFACKHFGRKRHSGGEVHTIGVMMLAFMPIPYVDASSSWSLRSKWQRAFIAAAGMYVELALAAVAAIIWHNTAEGSTAHQLAFNVMFIASVTTLLFNANPLIRFDGYYILSDLIEMPNLAQRSKDYLYYLVKKYLYHVRKPRSTARTAGEKPVLLVYGVASFFYRIFITVTIVWFVADKMFFIGAAMAIAAVIGFVFVPAGKFIRYLFTSPELSRTRGRSLLWTAAGLAALVTLIGVIRVPEWKSAEALLEPREQRDITILTDGELVEVLTSGSRVESTQTLLFRAENDELAFEQRSLEAQVAEKDAQYNQHLAANEGEAAWAVQDQIAALRDQISRVNERRNELAVYAPFAGTWSCGPLDSTRGVYATQGQVVGRLVADHDLFVRVTAGQNIGPRLKDELALGDRVRLRVRGQPDFEVVGTIEEFVESGRTQLPSAAIGYAGGGGVAIDPEDPNGNQTAQAYFEIHVRIKPEDARAMNLRAGQAMVARFTLPNASIAEQSYRVVRQMIQGR